MSANTISNNKISNIVNSQVPFFVRNDHQKFVQFLEAYYRYLEQNDKAINRIKNVQRYYDIDLTEDIFAEKMYKIYLKYIPESSPVDKNLLLKHVKDFYRSKGTEKSVRFLMNILFSELPYDVYYPKQDVLRASDGKWYVKKTLRITDVRLDNQYTTELSNILNFVKTKIKGNNSNATALVESVDRFYETDVLVDELVLSNIDGNFENGEQIFAKFDGVETEQYLSANVFGGKLYEVKIINPGSLYETGTQIPLENQGTGSGGVAIISKVSSGTVKDIFVLYGGSGYQVNGEVTITTAEGDLGTGAKANIFEVQSLGTTHPNSYNIMYSTIDLVANDILDYANVYTALNNSNVNTTIANATSFWSYGNTGPIVSVLVLDEGTNYKINPTVSAISNTQLVSLGILGRMAVIDGGVGYEANDEIYFENVWGGYGFGAKGNVRTVNSHGSILSVGWVPVPGQYVGGSGYSVNYLPKVNVVSQNVDAFGANITVSILGTDATLVSANSVIGGIEEITLVSKGINYTNPPTLNLQPIGDGTALANVSVLAGIFSYPGRFLNDDGHISSYNFLQDRDYYQSFSYVIRSGRSIEEYRQPMLDLIHPAGMKMFGEYDLIKPESEQIGITTAYTERSVTYKANNSYVKTGNTINIGYTSHGLYQGNTIYLDFVTGGNTNVQSGIYTVNSVISSNYFDVIQKSSILSITIGNAGWGYNANSYIVFTGGDGSFANATFTTNTNGSIISITLINDGLNYTVAPTATASGSNSTPATFTVTLKYANNTSGNVDVGKITT